VPSRCSLQCRRSLRETAARPLPSLSHYTSKINKKTNKKNQHKKMKINTTAKIRLDEGEQINTAALATEKELIILLTSGDVINYDIISQARKNLFSLKNSISYADGGFDCSAASSIYCLGDIVVVVNDYLRHGFVYRPNLSQLLHLWRGEYHCDISKYPIALFEDETGAPHLIYGEDWNHVQIMNLDSLQILTAAKSLIEFDAEAKHLDFYSRYGEPNKLAWPRPYDYFFADLELSPDGRRFLSRGWVWGSCDAYNIYDIEHFITSPRILEISVGGWEHDSRPACWVDADTVAVAYNPFAEGDDDATKETPWQLHFYQINAEKAELKNKIDIINFDFSGMKMQYLSAFSAFSLHDKNQNFTLFSLSGELLFVEPKVGVLDFYPAFGLALQLEENELIIGSLSV
jgi:hypothetical protein